MKSVTEVVMGAADVAHTSAEVLIDVPSTTDGRSSRWEEHRAVRRHQLIKTARRAIDALGPGASMEEIAAAADTSKSVYYRYFGDKTGLQRAMAEVVTGQMQQRILDAAKAAPTPREGLHGMVLAYLQMARTSPNVYAFVTRVGIAESTTDDGGQDTLAHFLEAITNMISGPMRAYLLSSDRSAGPHDATPDFWPAAAIGMIRAAGENWLSSPDGPGKPTEEQMAHHITGWLFDGISRIDHGATSVDARHPGTTERSFVDTRPDTRPSVDARRTVKDTP